MTFPDDPSLAATSPAQPPGDDTPPQAEHAGHRARLRERFLKSGFSGFAEHEIVELLLTLCIPRCDVKRPAKELLKRFGSLRGVLDAPPEQLRQVPGIGTVAPVALHIIRETASLYLLQGAEDQVTLNSVDKLADFWRARLGGLKREVFEVAYLDTRYRLIRDGVERLEEGTIDRAHVYPRKVMEAALRRGAAHIVVAHNHPAADARPSEADKVLTRMLEQAGSSLGVGVIDHLIIAQTDTFSFRRAGLIAGVPAEVPEPKVASRRAPRRPRLRRPADTSDGAEAAE